MKTLLLYLLKVNIALIIFYLFYVILLKRDTFIKIRRYFYLSAILFSLLYPLFRLNVFSLLHEFQFSFIQSHATIIAQKPIMTVLTEGVNAESASNSLLYITVMLALMGAIFFLIRFFHQVHCIFRIRSRGKRGVLMNVPVYCLSEEITPFSFFKWIFVNPKSHTSEELSQILLHEQTHGHQWHSVDIILAELLIVFFWWNPFVWLMKKEIVINLEYLADSEVLRSGVNSREYQYHLLHLTYHETAVQIINNFNVSQLKQRIMMMNKSKSPVGMLAKYLMIVPLVLLLITMNSYASKSPKANIDLVNKVKGISLKHHSTTLQKNNSIKSDADKLFMVVDTQPEYPGGLNAMIKFLSDNIKYPDSAKKKGIQGCVFVSFVVDKDGRIADCKIIRSLDPMLDAEAIRVLKLMPVWTPGKLKGKPVRVLYTLPIQFNLQSKEEPTKQH